MNFTGDKPNALFDYAADTRGTLSLSAFRLSAFRPPPSAPCPPPNT